MTFNFDYFKMNRREFDASPEGEEREIILRWLEFAHAVGTQPHNMRVTAHDTVTNNLYIVHLLFDYDDNKYHIKYDLIGGIE